MDKVKASNILNCWMNEKLPTISQQKRHPFRPTHATANKTWRVLNATCFNNELKLPTFTFHARKSWWGMCCSDSGRPRELKSRSCCEIMLSDKIDKRVNHAHFRSIRKTKIFKRIKRGWNKLYCNILYSYCRRCKRIM